jgi:hypothetical protein
MRNLMLRMILFNINGEETKGDESIEDVERIGNEIEEEVVRVTSWWLKTPDE